MASIGAIRLLKMNFFSKTMLERIISQKNNIFDTLLKQRLKRKQENNEKYQHIRFLLLLLFYIKRKSRQCVYSNIIESITEPR
jgi:hypothetical protein